MCVFRSGDNTGDTDLFSSPFSHPIYTNLSTYRASMGISSVESTVSCLLLQTRVRARVMPHHRPSSRQPETNRAQCKEALYRAPYPFQGTRKFEHGSKPLTVMHGKQRRPLLISPTNLWSRREKLPNSLRQALFH